MTNLKVEKLSEKYIDSVFKIESQSIGKCDKETIKNTIKSDTVNYYLLLESDEVVGFFECSIIPPESELYDIAIVKDKQGKGYSKILMNYYIDLLKSKNVETVFLEVNIINNKAISLYEKFGFKKYSERKNYYGDNDAVLMKLDLV